jgi:hypothetical protein
LPGQLFCCEVTGMGQLRYYPAASLMNCGRHFFKSADEFVLIDAKLPWARLPIRPHVGVTCDNQPHAAACKFAHHFYKPRSNRSIFSGKALPSCRPDESIRQLHSINRAAFE